jgi:hypothetical protein
MGIETILTIAVAAAILGAAVVVRVVILGAMRLGLMAWRTLHGPTGRHRVPRLEHALPRVRITERLGRAVEGIAALALYVAAAVASAARAVYAWARPRALEGYRRLLAETEDAYSGARGGETYQAIGETATTWGGRPHAVLTRN